jgi:hypothetical protein
LRTALVTTSYLEPQERYDRMMRFLNYYTDEVKTDWDIIILDNASKSELLDIFCLETGSPFDKCGVYSFPEHYDRPSHLDYKYLWRAVHKLQDFFKDYDKIVYMDNDFYILKQSMIDYINNLQNGWTTFYCNKYKFPETGCHVVLKDCEQYKNFVNCSLEDFFKKHNNTLMEHELPVTHIEHKFIGDRYGEKCLPQTKDMDYYAQAFDNSIKLKFEMK